MDYSLLLAVHNITEEMKSTLVSSNPIEPVTTNIHEEITSTSTDSGITVTTISKLPTYIQYLRVIEFIRAQQEPSLSDSHHETASIQTVKPELSPIIDPHKPPEERLNSTNINNRSSLHHSSSQFNVGNGLIGGDVWYHRQSLSRLAMYEFHSIIMNQQIFPHSSRAGIPAVNQKGDLLLLYVGIIDILQNYRLRKKLEHAFKSTLVTRVRTIEC